MDPQDPLGLQVRVVPQVLLAALVQQERRVQLVLLGLVVLAGRQEQQALLELQDKQGPQDQSTPGKDLGSYQQVMPSMIV